MHTWLKFSWKCTLGSVKLDSCVPVCDIETLSRLVVTMQWKGEGNEREQGKEGKREMVGSCTGRTLLLWRILQINMSQFCLLLWFGLVLVWGLKPSDLGFNSAQEPFLTFFFVCMGSLWTTIVVLRDFSWLCIWRWIYGIQPSQCLTSNTSCFGRFLVSGSHLEVLRFYS